MAYPLLDNPQRNWFLGNLKTQPTAAPTWTIILYGDLEGHGMKEPSRETGRWDDNFVRRFGRTWDEGAI